MTQSLKPIYKNKYLPTFLLILGALALLITASLPYTKVDDKVFILSQFITHSIQKNIVQLVILPVLLYPYLFAAFIIVFTLPLARGIFSGLADGLHKKFGGNNSGRAIKYLKGIVIFFISNIALIMNLYIYFGFYMTPLKGASSYFLLILGIILLLSSLLVAYHLRRLIKIQSDRCSRMLYMALNYSLQSVVYFAYATIILLRKDSVLLMGGYLALFAAFLILFGLSLLFLRQKDTNPDSLIPLPAKGSTTQNQAGSNLKKSSRIIKL